MASVNVKAIKASRLKEKALRLELLNAMRKMGRQIRTDFDKTTATWNNRPTFELLISLAGAGPTVLVGTNSKIYGYVDQGTPGPYLILPKRPGGSLAFGTPFSPKTTPRVIGSGPGSRGSNTVVRPYVIHPGIKPREFSKVITTKWDKQFKREMEGAMRKAARASGHSA